MNTERLRTLALLAPAFSGLLAAPATAQTPQPGVDSDSDGVADNIDIEPCDVRISGREFVPADRTYGMLLFEDMWPARGDFDFNDAVLGYHVVLNRNSMGRVTSLRVDLDVMAVGAAFDNGLAIQLPFSRTLVDRAYLAVGNASYPLQSMTEGTSPAAAWTSESSATFTLADSLHGLFGVVGELVNTDPLASTHPYVHLALEVHLGSGASVSSTDAPFDIFIFDTMRGIEVHLPRYRGTSRLDTSLVGTGDDGTNQSRAFVTRNGIPFALDIPETVLYPAESQTIDALLPDIVSFGRSNGQQATDFYRSTVVTSYGYTQQMPNSPLGSFSDVDLSCFTPNPGRCGSAATTGHVSAPSTGLCDVGSASLVSTSGGMFSWTCTGSYSQPTTCQAPDWVCQPNTPNDCSSQIANGSGSQNCNGSGTGYTSCVRTSCNPGYVASGNGCIPQVCTPGTQTRSCTISHGTGRQTCNNTGTDWGSCTLVSCNQGYTASGNTCQQVAQYGTIRPGDTTTVARLGDYSARCLSWSGNECVQARLEYQNQGLRGMCWGNLEIFELWCYIATGDRRTRSQRNVCNENLSTDSTFQYLLTYDSRSCEQTWSGRATTIDSNPPLVGHNMCRYTGSCGCDPRAVTCYAY